MNPKLKKGMAILLVFAMLFSLVPATAFAADSQPEDTRTVVSNVTAVSNSGDIAPEYGKQATNPTFTITEGKPAWLGGNDWWKKVDGEWTEMAANDTFGEGTYRYRAQLRIDDKNFDGNDGTTHVLAKEGLTLKVDGKNWEVGSVSISDDVSFVRVFSPEFTVTAPGEMELTFYDSTTFDIGKNYVGRAITSYSVAANVEGGTSPYTFSRTSGPAWISVSAEGEVSGTPAAAGENAALVVKVTDSKGAEKTISIDVADTKMNPDDRTKISAVSATSDIKPEYGEQATKPTFTITEGKPAWLSGNDWWKKVDGEWTEMAANDTFGEGTYRYRAQLRIDNKKFDGNDGTTHVLAKEGLTLKVDGKNWEVGSVSISDDVSFVRVFSPEFTVTKPVIQAISIKGITAPVAGETADVSGIDTANKGITLGEKQWYKVNKDSSMTKMGASDKFVANQTYYLVIPYTVSEDYTVSESAEVLHDLTGGKAEHNSAKKTIVIEYTVPETYTVTVTTDGNGTAEASVAKAAEGTTVTLTATPKEGYEFDKWDVTAPAGFTFSGNSFTMPENDVVVKASFKEVTPATYNVKFYANNGSGTMDTVTVVSGEYTLPECRFTAPTGQQFKAWLVGNDEKAAGDKITVTANTTVKAIWEAIEYDVTVTNGTASPAKATMGTTVTLTANQAPSGQMFDKWVVTGAAVADEASATTTFTMPAGSVTAQATYKEIPVTYYTVTFDANGGSVVAEQNVIEGEKAEKPADPTRDGFAFKGWTLNGVAYDFNSAVTGDITLVATWEAQQVVPTTYTVSFDSAGGSAVTAQTIEEGQKVTKPADPTRDGFDFKGWTLNGVAYDFNTAVNGNITLVANWEAQQVVPTTYTVTFDSAGGTAVIAQTIEEGQKATKPADPTRDGFDFKGWTLNGSAYDFNNAVTGNITLVATWEAVHTHTYATEWSKDATNHWHAATCGHNVVDAKAAHVYDNSKDAECNVCGYTRTVSSGSSSGGGFTGKYNYPVVIADNDNADVTASKNYAVAGDKVTVTVDPAAGKQVDEVIVTDADGDIIPVTKAGDNQYTFTMPAGKVNVSVTTEAADYDLRIVMQINNKNILVNGKTMVNDVAPVIVGDRTLVPIRVITELLGGSADWDEATRTVTLKIDGKTMNMTIGKLIPGFGTSAVIMNDRTYVPVRYVMEMLGAEVEWINATRQIIIEK